MVRVQLREETGVASWVFGFLISDLSRFILHSKKRG
jgi:hypothetical protein